MMKKLFFLIMPLSCILFVACQPNEKTLKVAATPVPHAELLEVIKPELENQGVHLKIVEVDDYNLPNRLLFERQVDVNFFQHRPFLDEQNQRFGYNLQELTVVHIEPLGVYSDKITSLDALKEGGVVAIPSDPTNEARALNLLQELNLIKLKSVPSSRSASATVYDIEENSKHLKFEEIDAAFLSRALADADLAVIPSNFALQVNLDPMKDALAIESSDSPYANVIVIREGEENREEIQKFKAVMTSDKMRQFILEKYKGCIIPIFKSDINN